MSALRVWHFIVRRHEWECIDCLRSPFHPYVSSGEFICYCGARKQT